MKKSRKFQERFYFNYCQFIQFVNDHTFSNPTGRSLIYLSNLSIIIHLLSELNTSNGAFQRLINIQTSKFISNFLTNLTSISWIFISIMLILVTLPIIVLLYLVVKTALIQDQGIDSQINVNSQYYDSFVFKSYRAYALSYTEVAFPIVMSLSISMVKYGESTVIFPIGIIINALIFFNLFLYIYYDLDLKIEEENTQYKRHDYKGVLIDSFLVGITIIVINMTEDIIPFIIATTMYMLRFLLTFYFKFYSQKFQVERKFSLLICFSVILCLLLSQLTGQNGLMLCTGVSMTIILLFIKNRFISKISDRIKQSLPTEQSENDDEEEQSSQSKTLESIKKQLWQRQRFVQAYRGLIRLYRKKNSHRQQLLITILKNKCSQKQIIARGGSIVADPGHLFIYQSHINIVVNMMQKILGGSMQILNFMKSKNQHHDLFIEKVLINISLFEETKLELDKAFVINNRETKAICLLNTLCKGLQGDKEYLQQKFDEFRDQILSQEQLRSRAKLFNPDVALIVINVMEQIGKITQISKNMKGVLGYDSYHLLNLPINGLMPFTIREIHDEVLLSYINNFEAITLKNQSLVQSYAYNKDFNFQKITVQYKFLMSNFETMELSGIIQKIPTEELLIFTDQQGNIEGWTKQAGKFLNLQQISGPQCRSYNLLPMLPSLVKYDGMQICCRTLIFKPSKIKNQKLSVTYAMKEWQNISQKQISAFKELLQEDEILDAFFIQIEMKKIYYLGERFHNRVYEIKMYKRVQNLENLLSLIGNKQRAQLSKKNLLFQQSNIGETSEFETQFSLFKKNQSIKTIVDLNFSLDFSEGNQIKIEQVDLTKEGTINATFFSNNQIENDDKNIQRMEGQAVDKQIALNYQQPKIRRNVKFFWLIIVLTITSFGTMLYDQISIIMEQKSLKDDCQSVKKINRVEMIMLKSIFNPNETYINQFRDGELIITESWLGQKQFDFIIPTSSNTVAYNYFYLLNVQIPSMLDGLLSPQNPNKYQFYQEQLKINLNKILLFFKDIEGEFVEHQEEVARQLKTKTISVLSFLSITAIIFSLYLIYIRFQQQAEFKKLQGFFKFQKTDISSLIFKISQIQSFIKEKAYQWNIQGVEYKKQNYKEDDIRSYIVVKDKQQNTINTEYQKPILQKFKLTKERQMDNVENHEMWNMRTKKYLKGIPALIIFLAIQLIFLLCYGILTLKKIQTFPQIINSYSKAQKLYVITNLQLTSLYVPDLPSEIKIAYIDNANNILQEPVQYFTNFYQLLEQAPCDNCEFLTEILNTNYHSFYSYFQEALKVLQTKSQAELNMNNQQILDLIYAADVVGDKIYQNLSIAKQNYIIFIIITFVASMVVFYFSLLNSLRAMQNENKKLESFIKYFDIETIQKNKHLNAIFDKNM